MSPVRRRGDVAAGSRQRGRRRRRYRGNADQLRDLFAKFLLMRNLAEQISGVDLLVMRKRGIFKTAVVRTEKGAKALGVGYLISNT